VRAAAAASWAALAALAVWDVANSPSDKLAGSISLCALAFAAALPALARIALKGIVLRIWDWAARFSPFVAAASIGLSHFLLKNPPGSALIPSVLFLVGIIAFVELARWARYTARFGDFVAAGVDRSWAEAFASRFVPLTTMAVGLSVASLALAAGFVGTWSALALAVVLITVVVVMARTAAKVA
jgi:hypothetical protein